MVKEVFQFEDELFESGVMVFVETPWLCEGREIKKGSKGLYLCLDVLGQDVAASAYIPRKQAKKIIKAMKETLNEE